MEFRRVSTRYSKNSEDEATKRAVSLGYSLNFSKVYGPRNANSTILINLGVKDINLRNDRIEHDGNALDRRKIVRGQIPCVGCAHEDIVDQQGVMESHESRDNWIIFYGYYEDRASVRSHHSGSWRRGDGSCRRIFDGLS